MNIQSENDYEDLLASWSDLESGLGVILANSGNAQEFTQRVMQYDRWMQGLLQRDPNVGMYLLFQLASNSPVGYSASHALICAVLTHLIAVEMLLPLPERDSLVHAALTMNIAMTAVQDELAAQAEKPSAAQQEMIRMHAANGALMLARLGVADDHWLEIILHHHDDALERANPNTMATTTRLARILKVVDRYAAMISPRMSRTGRSATESARSIMAHASAKTDEVGHALVRVVGLCPPGTYVRLDNDQLAIVLRRSSQHNHPFVAVISKPNGEWMATPSLHSTEKAPHIRAALAASDVRARLNHYHILQLGADAAQTAE